MKRLLLLLLAVLASPVRADEAYLAELQARATELKLSQRVEWRRLVHYQFNRYLPGVTSTVDSPNFFLAPDGGTRPESELRATLASFFSTVPRDGEPPQCRAKARYEWLKAALLFDPQRLPEQPCERYEQWVAPLKAAALTLVFASAEISGPATMFGHTLMRVDSHDTTAERRLLSHAINYSAIYFDDEGSLGYALRGIAGGYVGVFAVMPYYEKVNEYARIEQRDLWEYPLRLRPDEVQKLLWHLWEMREVEFNYYFFSENCSYMLLSLLEAARPDLDLTRPFFKDAIPYVIPLDTVRALREAGVLGEPEYRPALAQKLRYNLSSLSDDEYDWVLDFSSARASLDDPRLSAAPATRQAGLLDTAHDYLYYLYRNEDIPRETGLPRAREALLARSRIREKSDLPTLPRPLVTPDDGHESSRLSGGLRRSGDDRSAVTLRARCALHDLLDSPEGYLTGGQIEFCNLGVLLHEEGVDIGDFRAVGVQSISPWDRAFKPWSWFAEVGARRYALDALAAIPQGELGGYADAGGGIGYALLPTVLTYAYGMAALDLNQDAGDGHALALGARAGINALWLPQLTQLIEVSWLDRLAGGAEEQLTLNLGAQWHLTRDWGLRAQWRQRQHADASAEHAEVLANWYF